MNQVPNIVVGDMQGAGDGTSGAVAETAKLPGQATDAKGRQIVVKTLDPLEEYRLYKIMGSASDSKRAVDVAMWAAAVRSINGEPLAFPNTERELQARIQLLGADGYAAVAMALASFDESPPGTSDVVKN